MIRSKSSSNRRIVQAWAVALALTSAACASTNQRSSQTSDDGPTAEELVADAGGDGTAGGGESGQAAASGRGTDGAAGPGTRTGSRTSGGTGGSGDGTGTGGTRSTSSGPRTGPIKVGVMVYAGYDEHTSTLALEGASGGNTPNQVDAMVKWVNARGGLRGRQVQPVLYTYDFGAGQPPDVETAAMCQTWTQDHKDVELVISDWVLQDALLSCLVKKNIPLVSPGSLAGGHEALFARYPNHYYLPGDMSLDKQMRAYADGMADAGFFTGNQKVGVLYIDLPRYALMARNVLAPEIRKHTGGTIKIVGISTGNTVPQQIGSAITTFRSQAIDRVMIVDQQAAITFFFVGQANSQAYYPRLGFTSYMGPHFISANVKNQVQLNGAVGVGWLPLHDVAPEATPPVNATTLQCREIMTKAGERFLDGSAETAANGYCNSFMFLKAALDRAGDTTPTALRAAVDALDTTFQAGATFATRFASGRHYGAGEVRLFAYDNACRDGQGCFRYTSGPRPVP